MFSHIYFDLQYCIINRFLCLITFALISQYYIVNRFLCLSLLLYTSLLDLDKLSLFASCRLTPLYAAITSYISFDLPALHYDDIFILVFIVVYLCYL